MTRYEEVGRIADVIEGLSSEHTDASTVTAVKGLLWLVERSLSSQNYTDAVAAKMRELHGVLAGIASDGQIDPEEVTVLEAWIEEHAELKGYWPFDEIASSLTHAVRDGAVVPEEELFLLPYFLAFTSMRESSSLDLPFDDGVSPVTARCAVQPELEFSGKRFCFTGTFSMGTRAEVADRVCRAGGIVDKRVTKKLDYLVIGEEGNVAWNYSCYGRKVEQALKLRMNGQRLVIVHEIDLADELEA